MPDAGPVDPPSDPPPADVSSGEDGVNEWDESERNEHREYDLTPWELGEDYYDPPVPDLLEVAANIRSEDGTREFDTADLTDDELAGIMAGTFTRWSQVRPELLPNEPIVVVVNPSAGRAADAIRGLLRSRGMNAAADAYPTNIPADRRIDASSSVALSEAIRSNYGTIGALPQQWSNYFGMPGQRKPLDNGQAPTASFSLNGMSNNLGPDGEILGTPVYDRAGALVGYRMPTVKLRLETAGKAETYEFPVLLGTRVKDQVQGIISRLKELGWDVEKLPGSTEFLVRGHTDPATGQFERVTKAGIFAADRSQGAGRPEQRGQGGVIRLEWRRDASTHQWKWAERRTP